MVAVIQQHAGGKPDRWDFLALGACGLIWGTTWLVLKFQLGALSPVVSIMYRFIASGLLIFPVSRLQGQRLRLTRREHVLAATQGVLVFGIGYVFVYAAEEHAPSALVAVVFASLSLVNTALFRLVLGQRAARGAWLGAGLGAVGVACLSAGQILGAPHLTAQGRDGLLLGVVLTLGSVLFNAFGNLATRVNQSNGAPVSTITGWAMLYGATSLLVLALVTGARLAPPMTFGFWASFAYLTVFGSVVGFLLYYGLAHRRGFTLASYTGALTPPVAMLVSGLFEHVRWDLSALVGLLLIVSGQVMIIRSARR
jgi:drug/metabolite transporter (DMT)-like permease